MSGRTPVSAAERFWSHVVQGPAPSDCWIWTGAVGDDGYGRFWVPQPDGGQRAMRPQRWLYEHLTGTALTPSTLLLHACDVPLCVHVDVDLSVSHLAPGTHRGNMLERVQRGRHRNASTALRTAAFPARNGSASRVSSVTRSVTTGGTATRCVRARQGSRPPHHRCGEHRCRSPAVRSPQPTNGGRITTDYAQQQWQQAPPVYVRGGGTTLSRWSVFLGIQFVLFGLIIPIPVLAIVFGIVGLARGTDVPGRAATGIVLGRSCG